MAHCLALSRTEGLQQNCKLGNTTINCRYGAGIDQNSADGLWYHLPGIGGAEGISKRHPKQLLIGMRCEA